MHKHANMTDFWSSCTKTHVSVDQMWRATVPSRPTVRAYMPNIILIGYLCRPWWAKNPKFYRSFQLRHSAVALTSTIDSLTYTTKNIPLSNGSKTVYIVKRLYGEVVCKNFVILKRDGEKNRKT